MLLNKQNISEVFRSFNVIFNKAQDECDVVYPNIAMEVPSSSSDETYAWLGQLPTLREWIGGRHLVNLSAHTYNIKNRDFELTVGVNKNDLADDKIGIYIPLMKDLAQNAKTFPDRLVFKLLLNSFVEKCYDGNPMISDKHESDIKSKGVKTSNKMSEKLSFESYAKARMMMMNFKGNNGNSLGLVPNLLVVSPQNEVMAKQITMCELIDGKTNIHKGTSEVLVAPELIDQPDYWFLLCTTRAIKPFIFQNRQSPNLVSKTNETDDNVFFDKQLIYGVDMRCNAGFGLWQLIVGSTGEVDSQSV